MKIVVSSPGSEGSGGARRDRKRARARRSWVAAAGFVAVGAMVLGGQPRTVIRNGETERPVRPHWKEELCDSCHPKGADDKLDPMRLLEPTARANCERCHPPELLDTKFHHPYDVKPSAHIPAPPAWPLIDGRLSCLSCHDILRQCRMDLKERWRNPKFLRSDPDATAVEFCLRCHREELYRSSSPHDQLDENGREREDACTFCHMKKPDVQRWEEMAAKAGGKQDAGEGTGGPRQTETTTVTLRSDIVSLCGNCHGVFPHPLGIPHLQVLDETKLARAVACEIADQFAIPVNALQRYLQGQNRLPRFMRVDPETHEATCVTCHNPHEAGVFAPDSPYARGAEGDVPRNFRLRMNKIEICRCCHRI